MKLNSFFTVAVCRTRHLW